MSFGRSLALVGLVFGFQACGGSGTRSARL